MDKQQLLELNKLGIIPGPEETMANFAKRADYCLSLKEHLSEKLQDALGNADDQAGQALSKGFAKTSGLFGFSPQWIPVFFSNYQLAPWHGGCAWIFQISEDSPTSALLQLRKTFRTSPRHLWIYHRDELVAHELSHAGRMAFEEPQFEEIIACRTSSSALRRWLGPIVQSSTESMIFVLALGLVCFLDIFLISFYGSHAYIAAMWLKLLPLSMMLYALGRLWQRQRHFDSCLAKLMSLLGEQKAWNVVYRLTDSEIRTLGKMNIEAIKEYSIAQSTISLRWQVIRDAYF